MGHGDQCRAGFGRRGDLGCLCQGRCRPGREERPRVLNSPVQIRAHQRFTVVTARIQLSRVFARLNAMFGRGPVVAAGIVLVLSLAASLMAFGFFNSTAPNSLTISTGPAGSAFHRNHEQYKKILAKQGVTLKILPSDGSGDNLQKLANPKGAGDVAFVRGGEANPTQADKLDSSA